LKLAEDLFIQNTKKVMTTYKKYHAHDEKNKSKVGDMVSIIESKPISKLKRWTVVGGDK
jgi:small subunit ribosomal protein S17